MANYNLSAVLSVTNNFTQPLKQFKEQISDIMKTTKQTTSTINKDVKDSTKGIKSDVDNTANDIRKKIDEIKKSNDSIKSKVTQIASEYRKLGKNASDAMKLAWKEVNHTNKSLKDLISNSKGLGDLPGKFKNIALSVGGIFGGGKLGQDVVNTYATFEESMSKVQALSGATGQDLEDLRNKAKEMGEKTSKSASESADALGYMALAGWDTQQMLGGLEPILRASEAGQMDLARCSDLVTDSMSAMGIQTEDLGHYLDVASKAQASSNTSLDQLMEAYIGCGGTLKNMNVPIEESATLLGTLANRGIKGSEAGNSLNSILVNLMGVGGEAGKALDALGVSMYNADGTNKGVTNTLKDLSVALGNCTQEEKDQFEAAIGGKTQMDTLQALLSGLGEEYGDLNGKLNNCNGYLNEAARIMNDNLKGQWKTFSSEMEGVKIAIGERLAPILKNVMEKINAKIPEIKTKITNFLDWLIQTEIPNLKQKIIQFLPIITGVASAFGAFKSINKAISIFKNAGKAFSSLKTALTVLTSPIGLIAIGIGLLVAAFIYAYTHSETFRNKVNAVIEIVKEKVGTLVEKVKTCFENIKAFLDAHQEQIDKVKAFIGKIIEGIIETFGNLITDIGTMFSGVIDTISGVIDIISGIFAGDWNKVWEGCKEVVNGAIETITGWWNGLKDLFEKPINFVVNLFKKDQSEEATVTSEDVGENAKGTKNWRGGWTWVNEEGGELMNLPNGTQIIPHDLSEVMVKEHARNTGNGMTVNIPKLADTIVVREDADIDKIGEALANKLNIARMRFA